jgi:hypothetical protein
MFSKYSFLKRFILFLLVFQLAGLAPFFVPKAHALFWEDDTDSNDPKEIKTRPSHFLLFDWVDDLNKDSKRNEYKNMDNQDKGPSVNNGARTLVIVASGIVGLGLGLFVSNRMSDSTNVTSNMFIGGAIGLGVGILAGALIMPADYNVDQRARMDYLKQRQAWLQDPVRLQVSQAFHPMDLGLTFKF